MRQNQVRPAYGSGRLQQISDLPMSHWLLRGRELRWITHCPQCVEPAQIVNVRSDALEYLAVAHVLQGRPHWVQVIRLCLPMFGKVADHGVSSNPAWKAFCDLLALPGIEVCVQTPGLLLGLVSWLLFLGRQLLRLLGRCLLLGAGLAPLLSRWWGLLLVIRLDFCLLVGAKDVANTRGCF